MTLEWTTKTYRYHDRGAIYLSDEQLQAFRVRISVDILSYSGERYQSYYRNPPQGVYGYCTSSFDGQITEEIEIRYLSQVIFDEYLSTSYIRYLLCKMFQTNVGNLKSLAEAIPAQSLIVLAALVQAKNPESLSFDSIRCVLKSPAEFDLKIDWFTSPSDIEDCKVESSRPPKKAPPSKDPPARDPEKAPLPVVSVPYNPSVPPDSFSRRPINFIPGDFSKADDPSTPPPGGCPNGAHVEFIGTARAGNEAGTALPGTEYDQDFGAAVTYTLSRTQFDVTPTGQTYVYTLNGQRVSGGIWYDLSVVSITCL